VESDSPVDARGVFVDNLGPTDGGEVHRVVGEHGGEVRQLGEVDVNQRDIGQPAEHLHCVDGSYEISTSATMLGADSEVGFTGKDGVVASDGLRRTQRRPT